jgi:ABC-type sugar transport system permease subunit
MIDNLSKGLVLDKNLLVMLLIALLVIYVLRRVVLWVLFKKGRKEGWKSLIPVYNGYELWDIGWAGNRFIHVLVAWLAVAFVSDITFSWGTLGVWIGIGVAVAALVITVLYRLKMGSHMAKRFNKKPGLGVLIALLPLIGYAVLAFSKSDYVYARDPAGELCAPGSLSRLSTIKERRARTGYYFILPFIIGFVLFMAKPMIQSLVMSFHDVKIVPGQGYSMSWLGFDNYNTALAVDPYYNEDLVNEISRMAINTISTLVLSFVIAVILNQEFKGRTLARAIFFLPVILSSGVLPGIEKQNEFYDMMAGVAESVEGSAGVNISASLQDLLSISGVGSGVFDVIFQMIDAIYDIVMASGIQIIVFLSGLQAISPSLYEAADVEGCSAWESFWKITFPMVSPLLLVNCIYTIVDFFMKNDNSVMERIYEVMYKDFKFGVASAMSWIYFGVALAFILISSFIISRAVKSAQ